jgi:hypothetical protein
MDPVSVGVAFLLGVLSAGGDALFQDTARRAERPRRESEHHHHERIDEVHEVADERM